MSSPTLSERDSRGRVPLARPVHIKYPLFQDFIRETASNISLGGMFIESDSPLGPGSELDFELSLDDGPSLIRGRGRVAWLRDGSDPEAGPAGMGVSFVQLEHDSLELVRRIVDEQIEQGGEPFDLLEAAIVDSSADGRFSKEGSGALGERGSRLAYWFSVAALSVAVGGLMVLAFDHYYVRPRLEALERSAARAAPEPLPAPAPSLVDDPAPDAQAAPPVSPTTSDPVTAVRAWAAAWQERRVADYLGSYSTRFVPSGGRTRAEWAELRSQRIGRQSNLTIGVALAEVEEVSELERSVRFVQSYASDSYRDRVRKSLRLVWEDGAWKIRDERVIRALPD